jgi:recombination protein RecA
MKRELKKSLKGIIDDIESKFGKGAIMALGADVPDQKYASISSGSIALNAALGIGGYPRGRIVEIYGPESSGKTTLCLHAIAEAQANGGVAAFVDAEHAFDPTYAKLIGVRLDELLLAQPDCGEQALNITETLTRTGKAQLVVIDSVAALTPKAEIDGEMGDTHMGLQARMMSQALRKLTAISHKTGTTIIFINQLRMKIGVVFGNPETTPGGNALKFYASVRLDVRRKQTLKKDKEAYGSRTRVRVIKNKCAPPFKEAEFDIRYGVGIDRATDLIEQGIAHNVIDQRGAHLSFGDERLGQGRERARAKLLEGEELQRQIRDAITGVSEGRVTAQA